jgi:hypothetical protein
MVRYYENYEKCVLVKLYENEDNIYIFCEEYKNTFGRKDIVHKIFPKDFKKSIINKDRLDLIIKDNMPIEKFEISEEEAYRLMDEMRMIGELKK